MATYKEWCERYERDPDEQQSKNEYAEYCKQLEIFETVAEKPKAKRGPKPKYGRPMTAAERMRASRARRRDKGMQQVWLSGGLVNLITTLQTRRARGETLDEREQGWLLAELAKLELK